MTVMMYWLALLTLHEAGFPPWLATCLGSAAGLVANYVLQREHLLRHNEPNARAISRYVANMSVLWASNLFLFGLLSAVTGAPVIACQIAASLAAVALGLPFLQSKSNFATLLIFSGKGPENKWCASGRSCGGEGGCQIWGSN